MNQLKAEVSPEMLTCHLPSCAGSKSHLIAAPALPNDFPISLPITPTCRGARRREEQPLVGFILQMNIRDPQRLSGVLCQHPGTLIV